MSVFFFFFFFVPESDGDAVDFGAGLVVADVFGAVEEGATRGFGGGGALADAATDALVDAEAAGAIDALTDGAVDALGATVGAAVESSSGLVGGVVEGAGATGRSDSRKAPSAVGCDDEIA